MKYNLKKKSNVTVDLTDDKQKKSLKQDKWFSEFVAILENQDFGSLKMFIKSNIPLSGFDSFLIYMLAYTASVYGEDSYNKLFSIISEVSPNMKQRMRKYEE